MARQRLSRKELKQPDQFVTWSVQVIEWVKAHAQYILYGLGGAVIIIGLILAMVAWQKQRHQQANVLLYEARKLFDNANKADSSISSEQVIATLRGVTRRYKRSPAAAQASWYLGHAYFQAGDHKAALAAYEQAQRRLPHDLQRLAPTLATLNMAEAQEALGSCAQAVVNFEAVLQSSAAWLRGTAYLGIGRCHEQAHAIDKAVAVYEQALADAEVDDTARQTLEERLALLQPE